MIPDVDIQFYKGRLGEMHIHIICSYGQPFEPVKQVNEAGTNTPVYDKFHIQSTGS